MDGSPGGVKYRAPYGANKLYIFQVESDDGQNVLANTILVADAMVIRKGLEEF